MCCSGDTTVKSTEKAQAAFTSTLTSAFQSAFANNQAILGTLQAKLTDAINNPHGFDPKTLALMKTNATENVQAQTDAATKAANLALSTRGGPTLGSGVAAQIQGGIAAAGAGETARELSNIDVQSGLLQNENYWNAIKGLTGVAEAENPTGFAGADRLGQRNGRSLEGLPRQPAGRLVEHFRNHQRHCRPGNRGGGRPERGRSLWRR